MSKLIGVIGLALLATIVQPQVSEASRSVPDRSPLKVQTAPIRIIGQSTTLRGSKRPDRSVLVWVQHARAFLLRMTPVAAR